MKNTMNYKESPSVMLPERVLHEILPRLRIVCTGARSNSAFLNCIRVERKAGVVTFTAWDLDVALEYSGGAPQPGEDVSFLVPIDLLRQAAKSADPCSVIVLKGESVSYQLNRKRTVAPIEMPQNDVWPGIPEITGPKLRLNGPRILRGILDALDCASVDETRFIINSVALLPEPDDPRGGSIVGTDGRRLVAALHCFLPFTHEVILPRHKALSALLASQSILTIQPLQEHRRALSQEEIDEYLADGLDHIPTDEVERVDPALYLLQTSAWRLCGRLAEGNFPSWKQVVPPWKTPNVFLPPHLCQSVPELIARLPIVRDNESVVLDLDPVEGLSIRFLDLHLPIPGAIVSEKTRVALSPSWFAWAIRNRFNMIRVEDEQSPVVFSDGPERFYVLMPMRLTWSEPDRAGATVSVGAGEKEEHDDNFDDVDNVD